MSSCSRRLVLLAPAALAACGFVPAYGPGGAARGLLEKVTVDAPGDKNDFDLVERLEERLGRTRTPLYALSYSVQTSTSGLAITPDNAITRFNVDGSATYALRRVSDGTALVSGRVSTFTSYAASGTPVSTEAARTDAFTRLMRLLADQIVTELVATSRQWSGG
jgi:LPS-assembly lipoprotein